MPETIVDTRTVEHRIVKKRIAIYRPGLFILDYLEIMIQNYAK